MPNPVLSSLEFNQLPSGGADVADPIANPQQREMQVIKAQLSSLTEIVTRMRANLSGPRVRIQNLEGVFKVVATVPTNSDDFQDGTILLYDDGSSTRRIYAKMNKTWRFVALT